MRQTSERLDEISWAIFVPLTTTVACSINKRTIRPRRRSVGCGWCAAGALARVALLRFVPVLLMRRLCANLRETTNAKLLGSLGERGHRMSERILAFRSDAYGPGR